jgi:flagellar basal-body rod protein FlgG
MKKLERPAVSSRYLELANVNAIREMAAMIDIQRSFESYQKVIQTMADLDKLSTSRVGRLS